ncbi:hypothetical protein KHQ82_09955 [Mycoplasmatota bacterium]|nr:hypothetical protein KHQ82_09955 [Mycoplasmatota bacterium]
MTRPIYEYKLRTYLLAIGLVLTTFTSIRINELPIGVGELTLLFWVLVNWTDFGIYRGGVFKGRIIKMMLLMFLFLSLGLCWALLNNLLVIENVVHDSLAYVFSFILVFTLASKWNHYNFRRFLSTLLIISSIIYLFTFLMFQSEQLHFGVLKVALYDRFTGGASNPNQLAFQLVFLPFVGFYLIEKSDRILLKILFFTCVLLIMLFGINTQSDGLILSWIITFALLLASLALRILISPDRIIIILMSLAGLVLVFFIIYNFKYNLFINFLELLKGFDDDSARTALFKIGLSEISKSPLVGYGPGATVPFLSLNYEIHNSVLDLILQAGTLYGGLFLIMIFNIGKGTIRFGSLMLVLISMFLFSMSHNVLRQPTFWIILFLLDEFVRVQLVKRQIVVNFK